MRSRQSAPSFTTNITLMSCRINGEPGIAIVTVDHVREESIAVNAATCPGLHRAPHRVSLWPPS